MKIPNDDNKNFRIKKFVEYQNEVPPVHRDILINYVREHKLNKDDIILLTWLMSNTYHEITSIIMFEFVKFENFYYKRFYDWYLKNIKKIQFGSAKKYNKMGLRFLETISFYEKNYGKNSFNKILTICNSVKPKENYEKIINFNKNCKNHGRFSSDLFNEILILFNEEFNLGINIKGSDNFDWENCANLTSAVFNIMYEDELADKFDNGTLKSFELQKYNKILTEKVLQIKDCIKKTYGKEVDTPMFVTKLCSFRNLFKNTRYGGFHHDRQLEYLLKYSKEYPETKEILKKILRYRKISFKPYLLGEYNNWRAVRTKRKKIWTLYGLTGVEQSSLNLLNEKK